MKKCTYHQKKRQQIIDDLKGFEGTINMLINNTLIENAEDLDIVMPMYNLVEYGKNYLKTSGSLWNYYRDELNSGAVGDINYSIKDSKSFDYKTSITRRLEVKYFSL